MHQAARAGWSWPSSSCNDEKGPEDQEQEARGSEALSDLPLVYKDQTQVDEGETEFLRKGQVGDWKNYFSPEQDARIDEWVNEHLGELGIPFVYELVDDAK